MGDALEELAEGLQGSAEEPEGRRFHVARLTAVGTVRP
jgi:hypothetical protein